MGKFDESELDERIRTFSDVRDEREGGIEPERRLWLKSRVWRFGRWRIWGGIGPVRRLLVKERMRRLVRDPIEGGIGPVTMPEKRMSWVKEVRLEREGERVPARPGELERPVPRVRVVTRELEQVTPEKEEQGGGAVVEKLKFQVEKNWGFVREVRVFLISSRAVRSSLLIDCSEFVRKKKKKKKRRRRRSEMEVFAVVILGVMEKV